MLSWFRGLYAVECKHVDSGVLCSTRLAGARVGEKIIQVEGVAFLDLLIGLLLAAHVELEIRFSGLGLLGLDGYRTVGGPVVGHSLDFPIIVGS